MINGIAVSPLARRRLASAPPINIDLGAAGTALFGDCAGVVYPQTSASSLTLQDPAAAVREDRGDGRGAGVWSFPARTNVIANPLDIANASWTKSGVTITAGQSDPLGGTSATRVYDNSAGALGFAYAGTGGTINGLLSLWYRDATPSPSADGALFSVYSSAGVNMPSAGSWVRIRVGPGNANIFSIVPAGQTVGAVANAAATGARDVFLPSAVVGQIAAPSGVGTYGPARTWRPNDEARRLFGNGRLNITLRWRAANTEPASALLTNPGGTLVSTTTPDGKMSIRWDAAMAEWILTVRGVDVLSTGSATGSASNAAQFASEGMLCELTAWYWPDTGECGLRTKVNGAVSRIVTGSATPGALSAPSSDVLWLGSDLGASGHYPAHWQAISSAPYAPVAPRFMLVGDSTEASCLQTTAVAATLLTEAEIAAGDEIYVLAQYGDRADQQLAKWLTSPVRALAAWIEGIVVCTALNDIKQDRTTAQTITNAQALVDQLGADCPGALLWISEPSPAGGALSGSLTTAQRTVWLEYSEACSGGGATPIERVDGRLRLDDVLGQVGSEQSLPSGFTRRVTMEPTIGYGDGLHGNQTYRRLRGARWREAFVAAGLLSS